jgi:hypothetical protein
LLNLRIFPHEVNRFIEISSRKAEIIKISAAGQDLWYSFQIEWEVNMRHILLACALLMVFVPAVSAESSSGVIGDEQMERDVSLGGATARALFIGFGSGNRAIGDTTGEAISAWSEGIGLMSGLLGAAVLGTDWFVMSFGSAINDPGYSYEASSFGEAGKIMIAAGAVTMISSRLFSAVRIQTWGRIHSRDKYPQMGLRVTIPVQIGRNQQ